MEAYEEKNYVWCLSASENADRPVNVECGKETEVSHVNIHSYGFL